MTNGSPIATYRKERDRMSLEAFGKLFSAPVNKSTIMRWERDGVPVERVLEVEAATGISRHVLRPDIFGALQSTVSEAAE